MPTGLEGVTGVEPMILAIGLVAACLALGWRRSAGRLTHRARLRELGWAALLFAAVTGGAGLIGTDTALLPVLAGAGLVTTCAPALPRRILPWLLLSLGLTSFLYTAPYGAYLGNERMLYGTVLAGDGNWPRNLGMALSYLFIAAGAWLLWRTPAWHSRLTRQFAGGAAGAGRTGWALLLLPVAAAVGELAAFRWWPGIGWAGVPLAVLVILAAVILVFRAPRSAADLAVTGLFILGAYGVALSFLWPTLVLIPPAFAPDVMYGAVLVGNRITAGLAGAEGAALFALGAWLVPRTIVPHARAVLAGDPYAALASRVQQLTETRTVAVDSAAAELRRIERDLHDGAQARLVALGMNLRALERLIPVSPEAALALVTEARESSSQALSDLRDLVRGIYPPVLADRGLGDAITALALDLPLRSEVDIELAGRPEAPVESACYFAVAEALANAAQHSGARCVQVRMRHSGRRRSTGLLRIEVTDDGAGGADPARGTGLAGVERRLATFDGILAVSSPPGGPTMIVMEVPCALSSPRTSSC